MHPAPVGGARYGGAVHPLEKTVVDLARAAAARVPWDGLDAVFGEVAGITTCRVFVSHPQHGRRLVPAPAELRSTFVELRNETADPERGAWFVASLHISRHLTGETVHETFTYDHDGRPAFLAHSAREGVRPVPPLPYDTDFVLDLADHPRSRRHTPAWLASAVRRPQTHDDELLEPGARGEARLLVRQLAMDVVDAHRGVTWSRADHEFVVLDRWASATSSTLLQDGTLWQGGPLLPDRAVDLVRELRETTTDPQRGAWLSALFTVLPDASFDLRLNADVRPYTNGPDRWRAPEPPGAATPGDAAWVADLETHPRAPEHLPAWWAAVVESERQRAERHASTPFAETRIGAAVAAPSPGLAPTLADLADEPSWRVLFAYVEPCLLHELRTGSWEALDEPDERWLWPRTLEALVPVVLGDVEDALARDGHRVGLLADAADALGRHGRGPAGLDEVLAEPVDRDEPVGPDMSEPADELFFALGDVLAEAIGAQVDARFPGVRAELG